MSTNENAPRVAPQSLTDERSVLRQAQCEAVMPMIGPLLDAWENAEREVMEGQPELAKWLDKINRAMETAGDEQPAPQPMTYAVAWNLMQQVYSERRYDAPPEPQILLTPSEVRTIIERAHGIGEQP